VAKADADIFGGKAVGDAGMTGALIVFVSALFDIYGYEGICGRFGRDRRLDVSISVH
jgi:hypothetical protein